MKEAQPTKNGGQYQFTINQNYEDYSSGRVLYSATGATNFPVRLVSEMFQRAKHYLIESNVNTPYTLYDPFCGTGYSLTVLGLLHGQDIKSIYASDTNQNALEVASKNLSLLNEKGLNTRKKELQSLFKNYKKSSHKEALESLAKLENNISNKKISVKIHPYNILQEDDFPFDMSKVNLIITDLPYNKLAKWEGAKTDENPTQEFLNKIRDYISPKSIIAISTNKKQKVTFEGFSKIKTFKIGVRKILFLKVS